MMSRMWQVEFTDEFAAWWQTLDEAAQDAVAHGVKLLEQAGPVLGRPHVDTVNGSKHSNMKELRATRGNRPLRVFFAFDPRRHAVLLIGGDKSGSNRFYEQLIPVADELFDAYLVELKKEGLI